MDDRVASALDEAFPGREVADVNPPGPSWNEQNRTVSVEFADGETVYLKLAVDGDGSRVVRERAVMEYVRANAPVDVPRVLASETDRAVPYLVTDRLVGRPLVALWSDGNRQELAREVGDALAGLHARRFEDHGLIVGGGAGGLTLERGSWTDVLVETIEEYRALAPTGRFDHHFDEVIDAIETNRDRMDDAPAALLHGDPAAPNCIRGDGGIGFVDWERSHVGDPVRELHRARDQLIDTPKSDGPKRLVTALHEGYRDRAGGLPPGFEDRRPVYEVIRLLGVSGFFEHYAEYLDEPAEDLERWLRAELDRRLAAL